MEEFKIYLLGEDPKHDTKMRIYFLFFSVLAFLSQFVHINYVGIIIGVWMLILAIGYKKLGPHCHMMLNDTGIQVKLYRRRNLLVWFIYTTKNVNIRWEDIQSIAVRTIKVEITLKDGSMEEVSIGNLMYKQVLLFKEKLQEFIQAKGIGAVT